VAWFRECWDVGDAGCLGGGAYGGDFAIGDVDEAGFDSFVTGEDAHVADEEGCHDIILDVLQPKSCLM
jgi:hypothetical protein